MVANGALATHISPLENRDVWAIIRAVFVLPKCIFLHHLANILCSKGSGRETTFSATCSTQSLLSIQLSAIQQEADWLRLVTGRTDDPKSLKGADGQIFSDGKISAIQLPRSSA